MSEGEMTLDGVTVRVWREGDRKVLHVSVSFPENADEVGMTLVVGENRYNLDATGDLLDSEHPMPGQHTVLVHGSPSQGFEFIGPVVPDTGQVNAYIENVLAGRPWWFAPMKSLDLADMEHYTEKETPRSPGG